MKRITRTIISLVLIVLTLSMNACAMTVNDAKDLASKVDIEDVKKVTTETVKTVADTGVEKGKELVDKLDEEYGDDIEATGAKTKSLWDSFVEWIKEAFNYIMHLFLFDSKDNLIGTLNEGIEKQNKDATSSVLDDITNIANNRVANAELENLNISSIDKVTSKLPEVKKKEKKTEEVKEEKVKKSVEEILQEAAENTKKATPEDIKEGVNTITDSISSLGENIEIVGDTIENLGIPNIGSLMP